MNDPELRPSLPPASSPTTRWQGLGLILGLAMVVAVGINAVRMLQPLPSVPPVAPAGGVLAQLTVPGVGPAWVELGEPGPHQSRPALAVRSIHPQVRFFPDLEQAGRAWGVYRVHTPETQQEREAELRWDGQVFRYHATSGEAQATVLTPEPVAGLRSTATRAGFRLFERGVAVTWSARRPEWATGSALGRKVEEDSQRWESQVWTEFFDAVREQHGARPGLEFFKPDAMSGEWPCELWQVVYHHSPRAVSVLHGQYQYLGGAHGRRHVSPATVIGGPSGVEWLDFGALFTRPRVWHAEVRRRLLEELRRQGASWAQTEGPPQVVVELQGDLLTLGEEELDTLRFTASSAGVFVHFEEYEAGSYAEGDYVVHLPWASLAPWVRPEVVAAFTSTPGTPAIPENPGTPMPKVGPKHRPKTAAAR